MKLEQLLAGLEHTLFGCDGQLSVTGICYDSRKAKPGDLFVAIRGFQSDGHDYVKSALEGGCIAAVVEHALGGDVPHIIVQNGRQALASIADIWFGHPAKDMRLVGVTGTNGKTTTTHLLKGMIEQCSGHSVGLIGTNQILIGDIAKPAQRTTPES